MHTSAARPTTAEINLSNLGFNLRSVKEFVGNDKLFMAVVKADAYGHGALECAARLEAEGADWFGVAIPEEGIQLRKSGVRKRILSLGSFWPGQEEDLLNYSITPAIFDIRLAERFNRAAKNRNVVASVHIKVDTGMGRVGVPYEELEVFAASLSRLSNLQTEGLMTHFAAAEDLSQNEFTNEQIVKFNNSVSILRSHGLNPVILDLANSPGAIAHPDSGGNMVRLGGVIYGLGEDVLPQTIELPELRGVLSLKTKITFLKNVPKGRTLGYGRTFETKRDSRIATLPIGYQDGFMRALSNNADVLIKGKYAPVIGRVSMDWTLIDVTDVEGVDVGEQVILIGEEGSNRIAAADLGRRADTISYEVTCGINRRVQRVFVG